MVSIIKLDCCFNSRLREVCEITEEVCPHKRFTKLWTFSVAPFAPHPPSTDTSGHCCLAPCCSNTNSNLKRPYLGNPTLRSLVPNSSLVEGFHLLFHESGLAPLSHALFPGAPNRSQIWDLVPNGPKKVPILLPSPKFLILPSDDAEKGRHIAVIHCCVLFGHTQCIMCMSLILSSPIIFTDR